MRWLPRWLPRWCCPVLDSTPISITASSYRRHLRSSNSGGLDQGNHGHSRSQYKDIPMKGARHHRAVAADTHRPAPNFRVASTTHHLCRSLPVADSGGLLQLWRTSVRAGEERIRGRVGEGNVDYTTTQDLVLSTSDGLLTGCLIHGQDVSPTNSGNAETLPGQSPSSHILQMSLGLRG